MAGKLTNMNSKRISRKEFDWSLVYTKHRGMRFNGAAVAKCKTVEERADCETWH